jgi:hypothetical protein
MEYGIKIQTLGTDGDCAVLLNSACLEECSREQLLALFGQELTHVRYRHLRILNMDAMLDSLLTKIPAVGPVASQTLKTLLLQWKEYAYYTADRGAAIAAGGKLPVYENLTMAMGRKLDEAGVQSLLEGSPKREEISPEQNAVSKVVLQIMINGIAVPFGMNRIRELFEWDADVAALQGNTSLGNYEKGNKAVKITVSAMDFTAQTMYKGAVKTVEAAKTGTEELKDYVETNLPVWEQNLTEAKDKTIEALQTGTQEVKKYVQEKSPEWKENLSVAKDKTMDAVRTGTQEMADYLREKSPEWKENLSAAKGNATAAFQAGMGKLKELREKQKQKKKDSQK